MYHRDFSPQNLCIYEFMLPNDADAEDLLVLKITNLRNAKFYYSYGRNSKDAKGGVFGSSIKMTLDRETHLFLSFENRSIDEYVEGTGFSVQYWWVHIEGQVKEGEAHVDTEGHTETEGAREDVADADITAKDEVVPVDEKSNEVVEEETPPVEE